MIPATGLARAIEDKGTEIFGFNAFYGTNTAVLTFDKVEISGAYTRDTATVTWVGDDPSFTYTGTDDILVGGIFLYFPGFNAIMCTINIDDPVQLSEGDTIIFTSIQATFTTDNVVNPGTPA